MTDTELSAIRARCEAATPGPWEVDTQRGCVYSPNKLTIGPVVNNGSLWWSYDLRFITYARTDIPALLAHIDEQRVEIEHLKRALEWIAQSDCRGEGNSTFCWRWCPCWSNKDRSGHCTGTIIEASMKATKEAVRE